MNHTGSPSLRVPGDKSISHRALLLGGIAEGESFLEGLLPGADCQSTAQALRAMGVEVPGLSARGDEIRIRGRGLRGLQSPERVLDCGNSGTTARLLLGLLSGLSIEAVLDGDPSLRSRPMRRVTGPLQSLGARFQEEGEADRLPIRTAGGSVHAGTIRLAIASAQVKSALLLAGLAAGVGITVVEPIRSRDHTERMLRRMGVQVSEGNDPEGGWRVTLEAPVVAALDPLRLRIPGDFSSAAFLLALGLLREAGAGPLRIADVGLNPTRTGLLGVLGRMGARIEVESPKGVDDPAGEPVGTVVAYPSPLRGVEVEGEEIPALIDEIPLIAAIAARAEGTTIIRDAGELRVKESDRISAMVGNLRSVGVDAEELPDGLVVRGSPAPLSGEVSCHHDHRIAMAFGVLGALPGNDIRVDDPEVVSVSFPGFWEVLAGSRVAVADPHPTERAPIVTLDGPAGSGKSTTAREVARRLGFRHLDSGALYRAITWGLMRRGVPESEWGALAPATLQALDLRLDPVPDGFRILLEGEDPGDALRTPEVTRGVSKMAGLPAVRERLLDLQRQVREWGGVVADGRDMGTVVFPDAEVKIFLTASLEERARRRLLQEDRPAGPRETIEEAARIEARDRADRERAVSPLRPAEHAVPLDTSGLTFEEQVDRIVALVRERAPARE